MLNVIYPMDSPSLTIVGLASKAVEESKERVKIAITKSGICFPKKKIIINLAPADIPKDAVSLDLSNSNCNSTSR